MDRCANPAGMAGLFAHRTDDWIWLDRVLAQRAAGRADRLADVYRSCLLRDRVVDAIPGVDRPLAFPLPVYCIPSARTPVFATRSVRVAALAEVSMFVLLAILAMLTAGIVAMDVKRCVRWARWFALLFATAYVLGVATRYLAAANLERAIDLDVLILGYANPRFPSALHAVLIPFLAFTVLEKAELRSVRVAAAIVLSLLWAINLGLGTAASGSPMR